MGCRRKDSEKRTETGGRRLGPEKAPGSREKRKGTKVKYQREKTSTLYAEK